MGHAKVKARNKRQVLGLVLFVVLFVVFYNFYWTKRNLLKVSFANPDNTISADFYLKIAADPAQRQKGLMFVKSMPEREGMIFIFPSEQVQSFWMRNTYIPLDMIFIGSDLKVIGILEQVPVLNEQARSIDKAAKYVIELNAGEVKKYNIKDAAKLVLSSPLPEVKE